MTVFQINAFISSAVPSGSLLSNLFCMKLLWDDTNNLSYEGFGRIAINIFLMSQIKLFLAPLCQVAEKLFKCRLVVVGVNFKGGREISETLQ